MTKRLAILSTDFYREMFNRRSANGVVVDDQANLKGRSGQWIAGLPYHVSKTIPYWISALIVYSDEASAITVAGKVFVVDAPNQDRTISFEFDGVNWIRAGSASVEANGVPCFLSLAAIGPKEALWRADVDRRDPLYFARILDRQVADLVRFIKEN